MMLCTHAQVATILLAVLSVTTPAAASRSLAAKAGTTSTTNYFVSRVPAPPAAAAATPRIIPSPPPKVPAASVPKPVPTPVPTPTVIGPEVDLIPHYKRWHSHDAWYQIPSMPIAGTIFFAHGCAHSATDFWPPSKECPDCLGLPMEVAHTKQALARGYAVLAVSSKNRDSKCYNWWSDNIDVASIINEFRNKWGLNGLPTYAMGVSAGGAFALKLPRMTRIDGVISEVLGVDPGDWGVEDVQPAFPPTVFLKMPRDKKTADKIDEDIATLKKIGLPHAVITLLERPIYPYYFSDMSPYISSSKSAAVYDGLKKIGMVGSDGEVLQDPRYTKFPWQAALTKALPALHSSDVASDSSQVYELMNVAYAWHEINAEYFTACLVWLETKGNADMDALVNQYKITGRLADLSADRYTIGGKPAQAGASSITKFSLSSRDLIRTFGPGAASPESSEDHVFHISQMTGRKNVTVMPTGNGEEEHDSMQAAAVGPAASQAAAMPGAEAPALPPANMAAVDAASATSAAWSSTSGGGLHWSLFVAVAAAFFLITT